MQPPDPPAPPVEYDPDRHWRNEDAGPDASPWATDSEGPSSPSGLGPSGRHGYDRAPRDAPAGEHASDAGLGQERARQPDAGAADHQAPAGRGIDGGERLDHVELRLGVGFDAAERYYAASSEAQALAEREVPDYVSPDGTEKVTFVRVPTLDEVPYPVRMEPNLVVEFYSRC